MQIRNLVSELFDGKVKIRDLSAIRGIMIHRCGVDLKTGIILGYDAGSICEVFQGKDPRWKSVAKVTGGNNPYTFMIGGDLGPPRYDGTIWQCLNLSEIGWHGRRFSRGYLGIGVIGDFRTGGRSPSVKQWDSLVWLVSGLCQALGLPTHMVMGHGGVANAHDGSKGPGKPGACPGALLVMDHLRTAVDRHSASAASAAVSTVARQALVEAGASFF